MDTEAKHGLPKVVALADKLARLVLDQIEKDGHINLENIRNALVGPLAQDEIDRQDERMRLAEKHAKARDQWEAAGRFEKGVKKLAEGMTDNLFRRSDAADAMAYGMGAYWIGIDPAGPCGYDEGASPESSPIHLWAMRPGPNGPEGRYNVAATRPLLKAFGDAIASGQAQRVSISDGTYVLPDGEVLTDREMFERQGGANGNQSGS